MKQTGINLNSQDHGLSYEQRCKLFSENGQNKQEMARFYRAGYTILHKSSLLSDSNNGNLDLLSWDDIKKNPYFPEVRPNDNYQVRVVEYLKLRYFSTMLVKRGCGSLVTCFSPLRGEKIKLTLDYQKELEKETPRGLLARNRPDQAMFRNYQADIKKCVQKYKSETCNLIRGDGEWGNIMSGARIL